MKNAIQNYFKNIRDIKKLSNTEYELKFPSRDNELNTDTYILEIRDITDDKAILLLFNVHCSTILFHNQLVELEYKSEMTNMFELVKTYDKYEIKKLDTDYLWSNKVITSRVDKLTDVKKLSIE